MTRYGSRELVSYNFPRHAPLLQNSCGRLVILNFAPNGKRFVKLICKIIRTAHRPTRRRAPHIAQHGVITGRKFPRGAEVISSLRANAHDYSCPGAIFRRRQGKYSENSTAATRSKIARRSAQTGGRFLRVAIKDGSEFSESSGHMLCEASGHFSFLIMFSLCRFLLRLRRVWQTFIAF